MQKEPGDVVVVRVSEQGDREDENFHSPKAQLAKAKVWSKDQGNRVVDAFEEIDVSGKLPLARRPGLLKAIEMVEAGEADHIVVAYFDRLVRSLKVQLEVIERVERAGGEIYAIDHRRLTDGTAATRMSNNMMGAAFQYYAEVTGEKVAAAQERVVARVCCRTRGSRPGMCAARMAPWWWSAPRPGSSCGRSSGVTGARMVLDAVRAYSATADAHGRGSCRQQIREADEAIERQRGSR
jgi:predicted site-specific integrase-resolvase